MKRKDFRACSVKDCNRQSAAKGFCSTHYEQFKRGITDPKDFVALPDKPECVVSGCDRPIYCKGGCRTHYDSALRFNLSMIQLIQIYAGGCGICGERDRIHIDHDHACCPGTRSCGSCIRGGLCEKCNMAVGALGDSYDKLLRAVEYLRLSRRINCDKMNMTYFSN